MIQHLWIWVLAAAAALPAQQKRPNFVFLLGEGQGWNSLSVAMDPEVPGSKSASFRTPSFERLANGKGTVWEGGLRVPLLVAGPGIRPGSVSRVRAWGADSVPTVAALAGVKSKLPDGVEGGSLTAVLRSGGEGDVERQREEMVFHFPHYDGDPLGPASAIILDSYKLIRFYESETPRLFDLSKDPGERRDLAAAMPEKAAELDRRLTAYLEEVGAKLPAANPASDPSKPASETRRGGRGRR